jgi:hypothetical protein
MKPNLNKLPALLLSCLLFAPATQAATNTNIFFSASQTMTVTASNMTTVTINSGGYRFTYSQDGYFTGGVGLTNPVGRFFSVVWPNGVQAQAYTAGPLVGNGANITIKRADGKLFDLQSFTGKILLNTAGAGGAFEIMPLLNGNDAFPNPLQYDCTGYGGMSFPYTTALVGYDTYQIHMWGDFALTALMLTDTNPVVPVSNITNTITANASPIGAGTVGGAGDYPSNTVCTLTASPNAGWGFKNWTQNGTQVSSSAAYNFNVRSNRALVANFVPAYTVTTDVAPSYGGSATGGGMFNSNSTVTVRAVAASGFQFVNWTDYGTPVSTATNYSFTITGNHALTANFAMLPQTALFDFDTGWPSVAPGQGMPGTQSNNLLTAAFSTIGGGWSIQSRQTSVIGAPPSFAGNFLYPGNWWSSFQIQFSAPITNLAFDFLTGDVSSEYNTPSTVRITAYTNSVATPAVGSGSAQGTWANGAYPDGHINFSSATPFTIVTIDIAPIGVVSGLLFVDNIVAQRATAQTFNLTATASPTNAGIISGAGSYASGSTANVTATALHGFDFANWTENGTVVETLPTCSFAVTTNRTLVANFVTNPPPQALGGTFYQLTNTPLAINIGDLMAFDHDPDGDPVYFISASATTSNGLVLTTTGTQILVPSNSVADSFTYTINDGNGDNATGTGHISIITNPVGNPVSLDLTSTPGTAWVNFSGVPWYYYTVHRATNVLFNGTIQTWPVQAGPDGLIYVWDDFADLGGKPAQSFYRLSFP